MSYSDPDWLHQSIDMIRQASQSGRPLSILGHGSKSFYGRPAEDSATPLATSGHSGVVDYDPTELVVVAKSGTALTDLEAVLAKSNQMLAFEPPRFAGRGTVGGMIASGLSGPRRMSAGAVKDFVLGMTVLDAQASPIRYGGTVMKNVAGYDVSRLHTGALGTLGLIVDVSIKVLPLPPAQTTLMFECTAQESIDRANAWGGQPLPVTATCWRDGRFYVRLAGAMAAVKSATQKLGGAVMPDDQAMKLWQTLRDQDDAFFSVNGADPQVCLWRVSVPQTTAHLHEIAEPQLIEWGGALRWVKTRMPADQIRAIARRSGGHATLFRAPLPQMRSQMGAFTEIAPALMKIHQRLKQELDPKGIFNPGRMFAGL